MKSVQFRFCALALALVTASAAQASDQISTDAFTMETVPGWLGSHELMSSVGGVTRVSLDAMPDYLNYGSSDFAGESASYVFSVKVKSGYTVTGFSLDGSVDGELRAAVPEGETEATYGTAHNYFSFSVAAARDVPWAQGIGASIELSDQVAPAPFATGRAGLDLGGEFFLRAVGSFTIDPTPASWIVGRHDDSGYEGRTAYAPSYARAAVYDTVLTIYTAPMLAPVPEPETYAMLLAGLAAIGVARRRRRA